MPSYDFVQNPIIPGQQQIPPNGMSYQQQLNQYNQYQQVQQRQLPPEPPKIKCSASSSMFSVKDDDDDDKNDDDLPKMVLKDPNSEPPLSGTVVDDPTKPRRNKKSNVGEIVTAKSSGQVEDSSSTIDTYYGTTMMLNNTLNQIDTVASELKEDLDQVRSSRTLKRKYDYITGLSNNLCALLSAKTNAIREINNAISKSNDMDYRREKDTKLAESGANDDKYLMDLYNSFVRNPNADTRVLGPSAIQTSIVGAGGVNSNGGNGTETNSGYLNYLSKLTPEQNTMFYEQDPNVKTVVIYDASNGNKFFQVMNMASGEVVPNVTVLDNRFLEDTTIDLNNKIAKNNNLHESYPVIIINENVAKEY